MDDRSHRELTKLHGGELPDDLWDRVMEGPRLAPLAPRGRSRVTAAVVAFAVFGLAAFFMWRAFAETPVSQPAGSDVVAVPPRGQTSAVFLADGRPVFVVHHQDGTVSVVDAFSTHRAWGVEELNVWCPSTREFVEVAHEAHFDEYGTLTPLSGPAGRGGVATFAFSVVTSDAAGDPGSIRIGQIQEPTTPGRNSGEGAATVLPVGRYRSGSGDRPHLRDRRLQRRERDGPGPSVRRRRDLGFARRSGGRRPDRVGRGPRDAPRGVGRVRPAVRPGRGRSMRRRGRGPGDRRHRPDPQRDPVRLGVGLRGAAGVAGPDPRRRDRQPGGSDQHRSRLCPSRRPRPASDQQDLRSASPTGCRMPEATRRRGGSSARGGRCGRRSVRERSP